MIGFLSSFTFFFFFNDTATTEIYTLSLHDALPINAARDAAIDEVDPLRGRLAVPALRVAEVRVAAVHDHIVPVGDPEQRLERVLGDLPGGDHQPEDARSLELLGELSERVGGGRLLRV